MKPVSHGCPTALGLLFLCASLLQLGCGTRQGVSTATYGSVGWESADGEQVVRGIDRAMVEWYLRGEQLAYVVWTDLKGGGGSTSGSSGGSDAGLVHHQTDLTSNDNVRFEFEYTLDTGNSKPDNHETVTIDGTDYHLEDGALILVSTQGTNATVKQIDVDPTMMSLLRNKSQSRESLQEALKSMANDDSDIRGFFESTVTGE